MGDGAGSARIFSDHAGVTSEQASAGELRGILLQEFGQELAAEAGFELVLGYEAEEVCAGGDASSGTASPHGRKDDGAHPT